MKKAIPLVAFAVVALGVFFMLPPIGFWKVVFSAALGGLAWIVALICQQDSTIAH